MAITRVSNRKVYSFRSSGESVELASKLANEDVRLPPVGIKTPVSLADDGKSFMQTFFPEWRPIPLNSKGFEIVFCFKTDISNLY